MSSRRTRKRSSPARASKKRRLAAGGAEHRAQRSDALFEDVRSILRECARLSAAPTFKYWSRKAAHAFLSRDRSLTISDDEYARMCPDPTHPLAPARSMRDVAGRDALKFDRAAAAGAYDSESRVFERRAVQQKGHERLLVIREAIEALARPFDEAWIRRELNDLAARSPSDLLVAMPRSRTSRCTWAHRVVASVLDGKPDPTAVNLARKAGTRLIQTQAFQLIHPIIEAPKRLGFEASFATVEDWERWRALLSRAWEECLAPAGTPAERGARALAFILQVKYHSPTGDDVV